MYQKVSKDALLHTIHSWTCPGAAESSKTTKLVNLNNLKKWKNYFGILRSFKFVEQLRSKHYIEIFPNSTRNFVDSIFSAKYKPDLEKFDDKLKQNLLVRSICFACYFKSNIILDNFIDRSFSRQVDQLKRAIKILRHNILTDYKPFFAY